MGYLSHIVVAVAIVVAADLGVESGWTAPWAILGLLPVPHLLNRLARARSMAGRFRQADLAARVLQMSPPLLFFLAVAGFGWQESVRGWLDVESGSSDWPEPALLLTIVPFLAFELAAIDARVRLGASSPSAIRSARRFQTRLFLSGIVPLALYLCVAGLLSFDGVTQAFVEEVALLHAAFAAASIALFALFLPAILRNTWETEPLERGLARSVLESVATRAEFRCKGLYVWRTGHTMANAAIVGFLARHRVVLFSDALLAQLPPRELAAVFGHEIGHAQRHHVVVFGAWTLVFFLAGDLMLSNLPIEGEIAWGLVVVGLAVSWYAAFGYLSRRFELDADLASHEVTGDGEALVRALENVGGGVHARARSSWRHFSVAQRVLFVRALSRDARVGLRLRRSLGRWARIGYTLFAAALLGEIVSLAAQLPRDTIEVELRLGRYDRALERVETSRRNDELAELVQRAAQAAGPSGRLNPAALDDLAVEALEAGDVAAALDWLEVGARRSLGGHLESLLRLEDALGDPLGPIEDLMSELASGLRGTRKADSQDRSSRPRVP